MKKYFPEITIAKGLTIILVILGHSFPYLQMGIVNEYAKWIVDFIYSFHMATFFILSGFVSQKCIYENSLFVKSVILNRAKKLLVPYFFYSIITIILKLCLNLYVINQFNLSNSWKIIIGINPNGGLWFLWTLFIISVLIIFLGKCMKRLTDFAKSIVLLIFGTTFYFIWIFSHTYTSPM